MVILPFCILFVLLALMLAFGLGFWTARQFQFHTNAGEVMVADEINSGFRRPHKLFNCQRAVKTGQGWALQNRPL